MENEAGMFHLNHTDSDPVPQKVKSASSSARCLLLSRRLFTTFLFSLPLMSSAFLDTLRKHELDQVESWCMGYVLHEGSIELTHGGGVIVLFDVSLQDNMRDHRVVMLLVIVT